MAEFGFSGQAYGEAGIVKLIRIMEREIVTGMRLLGAARVSDLTPAMVSTSTILKLCSMYSHNHRSCASITTQSSDHEAFDGNFG